MTTAKFIPPANAAPQIRRYQMYIGGEFVASSANRTTTVFNPATEEALSEIPDGTADDVCAAVLEAEKAQKNWCKLPAIQRAGHFFHVGLIDFRHIGQHESCNRRVQAFGESFRRLRLDREIIRGVTAGAGGRHLISAKAAVARRRGGSE